MDPFGDKGFHGARVDILGGGVPKIPGTGGEEQRISAMLHILEDGRDKIMY